jgi:agmatinase
MDAKVRTFGGEEIPACDYGRADVVFLPVPYEKTTTYRKGTKNGPQAILNASPHLEFYDEDLDCVPSEMLRMYTMEPLVLDCTPELMVEKVANACSRIMADGKVPVVLGGEHSITVGVFRAVKKFSDGLSVVQFDAHGDLRNFYEGSSFNHACVMRRICDDAHTCQIGIRAIDREEAEVIRERKLDVFFAKDIAGQKGWQEKALKCLKEDVFLTFDVDALDPSIIPSTGTPEPGGLGWYETLKFLRELVFTRNVIGFDVMELSPEDSNKAPDFTVAKLIYKIIGYMAFKKRQERK